MWLVWGWKYIAAGGCRVDQPSADQSCFLAILPASIEWLFANHVIRFVCVLIGNTFWVD